MFVNYTPEVDKKIRNADQLPRGLGCRYLLCLVAEPKYTGEKEEVYIALNWVRKRPKYVPKDGVCIVFGK